jgi:hypothetical protein
MLGSDRSYEEDGRHFYCEDDYDQLIRDILAFRERQLDKYGFSYYEYMVSNKNDSKNKKGFWVKSRSFND